MTGLPPIPELHLQQLQSEPRRRLLFELRLGLDFVLVPVLTAVLALAVSAEPARLATPQPMLLLAGLVVLLLQYRRGRGILRASLAGALASLVAWLIAAGIALVIGAFGLLDCLGPGGGCLPW
jgi:lipopolysaccharide export LptBFGC system permease protein LptF